MKETRRIEQPQPGDGLLPSPRNCMRSRGTGHKCDVCGVIPIVLHVPIRARGQFCPSCCGCGRPAAVPELPAA